MQKIVAFELLDKYRVWLRFEDGVEGTVDLSRLVGLGVFAAWGDYAFFHRAFLADQGALTWPGELDLCPDEFPGCGCGTKANSPGLVSWTSARTRFTWK